MKDVEVMSRSWPTDYLAVLAPELQTQHGHNLGTVDSCWRMNRGVRCLAGKWM